MPLNDKMTCQQVLGSLLQRPQLLSQIDKYRLYPIDFSSRLERAVFAAIHGLYYNGATKIAPIDVENFLSTNDYYFEIFKKENGIEYLQDICELANCDNFDYYYNKLKKLNLLQDLKKQGIDISNFYIEDLTDPRSLETNQNFETLTISDIISSLKKKILKLETEYSKSDEVQTWNAADEIDEVVSGFGDTSSIGLPIQGAILNKIINGAELGALTIRSAPSSVGKTRHAVGDACLLAYPIRYNTTRCEWEAVGNSQKVLFIITEQLKAQILKMILAYISGVNESKFKLANFSKEEEIRIAQAKEIMKLFRDNMIIIRIPNPSIELVKAMIRETCITHDIGYVFYDYVFISPSLLDEFRGFSVRNDKTLSYIWLFRLSAGSLGG